MSENNNVNETEINYPKEKDFPSPFVLCDSYELFDSETIFPEVGEKYSQIIGYKKLSPQDEAEKNKALEYWKLDWDNVKVYDKRYLIALFYALRERIPTMCNKLNWKSIIRDEWNIPFSLPNPVNGLCTKQIYYAVLALQQQWKDKYIFPEENDREGYGKQVSFLGTHIANCFCNYSNDLRTVKEYIRQMNYCYKGFGGNTLLKKSATFQYLPNMNFGIVSKNYQTVGEVWPIKVEDVVFNREYVNAYSYDCRITSGKKYPSSRTLLKSCLTKYLNSFHFDIYEKPFCLVYANKQICKTIKSIKKKYESGGEISDYAGYWFSEMARSNLLAYIGVEFTYHDEITFRDHSGSLLVFKEDDSLDNRINELIKNKEKQSVTSSAISAVNSYFDHWGYGSKSFCVDTLQFLYPIRGKIRVFVDIGIRDNNGSRNYYNVEIPCEQKENILILNYLACAELQFLKGSLSFTNVFDSIPLEHSEEKNVLSYGVTQFHSGWFELYIRKHEVVTDLTQGDYPLEFV